MINTVWEGPDSEDKLWVVNNSTLEDGRKCLILQSLKNHATKIAEPRNSYQLDEMEEAFKNGTILKECENSSSTTLVMVEEMTTRSILVWEDKIHEHFKKIE